MSVAVGRAQPKFTSSSGAQVRYFDTSHTPILLYNGTLNDESGNGHDLVLQAGSIAYADIMPGVPSLYLQNGTRLGVSGLDSQYQITGDVTIMASIVVDGTPTSNTTVISCSGNAETEATNKLYGCHFQAASNTTGQRLSMAWEHSTGSNDNYNTNTPDSLPPVHVLNQMVWRRTGTVADCLVNGVPWGGAKSTGLSAASGGSSSPVFIGANTVTGTNDCRMMIMSIQVIASSLSDAQIKAEFNRTMGPVFGERP